MKKIESKLADFFAELLGSYVNAIPFTISSMTPYQLLQHFYHGKVNVHCSYKKTSHALYERNDKLSVSDNKDLMNEVFASLLPDRNMETSLT